MYYGDAPVINSMWQLQSAATTLSKHNQLKHQTHHGDLDAHLHACGGGILQHGFDNDTNRLTTVYV